MTLNEALSRIRSAPSEGASTQVFLACGFQALHLSTLLKAYCLNALPDRTVQLDTGLYGDLPGNIRKAADSTATAAAVIIEWSDLDPRLGLRSSGGWAGASRQDIPLSVRTRAGQLRDAIQSLASKMPVAVAGPSLPLPPVGSTIGAQASVIELELRHEVSGLLLLLSELAGVRIVQPLYADQSPASRLDAKMELLAGFPYTIPHADAMAKALSAVLFPPAPKKGLITDLDDTLWAGLVGEIGVDAVCWDHANHAQPHGLYQQMLGRLADCGVLIAVASKNEQAVVKTALERNDLFFDANTLFPVIASWGPKSQSVAQILATWNIGADSVVFVDDNPMELDEVRQAFPGIVGLQFHPKDPAKVWNLIETLRDCFGKPVVLAEDSLRRESIRASAAIREAGDQAASPDFLQSLQGVVTLDFGKNGSDKRPLELINKTNQFNLNGRRISEGEWQRILACDKCLVVSVSYQDKFGPLGKIGVLVANQQDQRLEVTHWVLSCRAFSRKIEHHTLDCLLKQTGAEAVEFAFTATDRNQPLQEFLRALQVDESKRCLTADRFLSQRGDLPHQVTEQPHE
jgi:FkbH-like protein